MSICLPCTTVTNAKLGVSFHTSLYTGLKSIPGYKKYPWLERNALYLFLNTQLQQCDVKSPGKKSTHSGYWNVIVIFVKAGFHQRILHKNKQHTRRRSKMLIISAFSLEARLNSTLVRVRMLFLR